MQNKTRNLPSLRFSCALGFWIQLKCSFLSSAHAQSGNSLTDSINLGDVIAPLAVTGSVGASDPNDWYSFRVTGGVRKAHIAISGGVGHLDVYLLRDVNDNVGETLAYSTLPANGGSLSLLWLDPGLYYVRVARYDDSAYQLNITSEPRPNSPGVGNNQFTTATE